MSRFNLQVGTGGIDPILADIFHDQVAESVLAFIPGFIHLIARVALLEAGGEDTVIIQGLGKKLLVIPHFQSQVFVVGRRY